MWAIGYLEGDYSFSIYLGNFISNSVQTKQCKSTEKVMKFTNIDFCVADQLNRRGFKSLWNFLELVENGTDTRETDTPSNLFSLPS